MALDLKGCRVLVTGASSGIGAGLAEALAAAGAVVGICARRGDRLSQVVDRCMEHSPDSRMWVVDLADFDAVDRLSVDVLDAFGGVDLLVNNAGIPKRRHVTALDIDTITQVMHINYLSPTRLTMALLPQMLERGSGTIVNISSIAAVCSTNILAYKTSKAGVNALTHQIAMENAKYNIRANVIMPGLMNTPMAIEGISKSRGIPKAELIAKREALVPLGQKMGTAWDVAFAALFLASDEAKFITGVMLPVDGGQSARIG